MGTTSPFYGGKVFSEAHRVSCPIRVGTVVIKLPDYYLHSVT
jgi:hypothetical protein